LPKQRQSGRKEAKERNLNLVKGVKEARKTEPKPISESEGDDGERIEPKPKSESEGDDGERIEPKPF
jgi:hypothetical protein